MPPARPAPSEPWPPQPPGLPAPGYRPWRRPAADLLAAAPPYWAAAALPRAAGRGSRIAVLVAATCGLAAIARAQVAPSGGGDSSAAPASGGGTAGGGTGGGGTAGGGTGGGAAGAPAPASDAAPGSLRATVENLLPGVNAGPAGPTTAPAWTITPGILLQEEWTDNTLQTAANHQSSLITVISPSLSINGSTSRLTANLYYSPSIALYTPQSSQNQVGQNLGADALLELAPEEFYIRTTGFAAEQSVAGVQGAPGTTPLTAQSQVQTYSFSIEPYLTHRFGGWGTAQVGGLLSQTSEGAVGGGATLQQLATTQEFAVFKSGENFGRLSSTLSASATQDSGTGALQGASQTTASYQAGYAITRGIVALASIGWEDIRYGGGVAPSTGATWSVGTELTPNPDSFITLSYGHQNGATAAAVDASYAPTATIRLSAQYQAGLTTATQSLDNALAGATFDALGHPINAVTGAAVLPAGGANFFGFNGTVYQQRSLSLSASWLWPRDAFQASVQQQTQTPVGIVGTQGATAVASIGLGAAGTATISQGVAASSGTYGSLSWQHDLSPVVSSTLSTTYGVSHNVQPLIVSLDTRSVTFGKQVQQETLLSVTAGLSWQMTRTLTGTLQYSYTDNDFSNGLPGVATNLVVLGLHKTF